MPSYVRRLKLRIYGLRRLLALTCRSTKAASACLASHCVGWLWLRQQALLKSGEPVLDFVAWQPTSNESAGGVAHSIRMASMNVHRLKHASGISILTHSSRHEEA
eukprot:TRINITY_DN16896_c0_g1_i2.p1 TRINITY_DN16896_c0_g1~~TRINITY_DN16896_c0_g1_i2.p1  ORF type:complete len:105 (-),score=12.87 TRINITY_DN16896_c0_g1_i2:94-408(-)